MRNSTKIIAPNALEMRQIFATDMMNRANPRRYYVLIRVSPEDPHHAIAGGYTFRGTLLPLSFPFIYFIQIALIMNARAAPS